MLNTLVETGDSAEVNCEYFDIGCKRPIEDLFLLTSRELMVVSKKHVYEFNISIDYRTRNFNLEGGEIYSVEKNEDDQEKIIINAKFCEHHKMYYMHLRKTNSIYAIVRFEVEGGQMIREVEREISRKFTDFEVSFKDPQILFFVMADGIFKFDFRYDHEEIEQEEEKLTKADRRKKEGIRLKTQERTYNQQGFKLFFHIKDKEINFIKFSKNMKFFYTHSGKVFQKYLAEGGVLVKSFYEHDTIIKDLVMPQHVPYMFTIDGAEIIKVWDKANERIISSLNQQHEISGIKDLTVLNLGNELAVRDLKGVTVWNLRKGLATFDSPTRDSLNYKYLKLCVGGDSIVYYDGSQSFYRYNILENMKAKKVLSIPSGILDFEIGPSGDILILRDRNAVGRRNFHRGLNPRNTPGRIPLQMLVNTDNQKKKRYIVHYYDLDVFEYDSSKDTPQNGRHRQMRGLNMFRQNKMNQRRDELKNLDAEVKGRHVVIELDQLVSNFNLVTNKGLERPQIYENDRLVDSDTFHERCAEENSRIQVLLGTEQGDCYKVSFQLTPENQMIKFEKEHVFDAYEPKINVLAMLFGKEKIDKAEIQRKLIELGSNEDMDQLVAGEVETDEKGNSVGIRMSYDTNASRTNNSESTFALDSHFSKNEASSLIRKKQGNMINGSVFGKKNLDNLAKSGTKDSKEQNDPLIPKLKKEKTKKTNKERAKEKEKKLIEEQKQKIKAEKLERQKNKANFSPVFDYCHFSEEKTEIVVFSEDKGTAKKKYCRIFIHFDGEKNDNCIKRWAQAEFYMKMRGRAGKNGRFMIKRMDVSAEDQTQRYFLVSTVGIAILHFNIQNNRLIVRNFLKKHLYQDTFPVFSADQDLFYIPHQKNIQIWDAELQYSVHSIELENKVNNLRIVTDPEEILLIYDTKVYYEIEVESLRITKKVEFINEETKRSIVLPLNFDLMAEGRLFKIPKCQKRIKSLKFLNDIDTLSLNRFPFTSFFRCFNKEDYQRHVMLYAEYYFERIKLFNFEDWFYGPLNPLIIAMYHNDLSLLDNILENFQYPRAVFTYWSPISFAFRYHYRSAIKVICDNLCKRNYFVHFSRSDFIHLLNSKYNYCHRLLATIPDVPALQNYPNIMFLNTPVFLRFDHEVGKSLCAIKRDEHNLKKKSRARLALSNSGRTDNHEETNITNKKQIYKREVKVFQVPFKYNYRAGSPDSIRFLDAYATSNEEEFILSEWKELIISKWRSHVVLHIIKTVLFWALTVIATISMVFLPERVLYRDLSIFFVLGFVLFEIVEFVAYSSFHIVKYLSDPWNYVDWCLFGILLTYFLRYHQDTDSVTNKLLGTLSLVVMYYRSFTHLRVFGAFTTLIGMINVIIQKLMVFFALLLYFYATTGLLMIKLDPTQDKLKSIQSAYVWTMFGGVESSDFDDFNYGSIAIIFGTLIVTVVLLNILIAFLSNLFSRLEDQQRANDLREKAQMMLDVEVIVLFFKYKITGRNLKLNRYEDYLELYPFEALQPNMTLKKEGRKKKSACDFGVESLVNKQVILFIFKSADTQDLTEQYTVDDNIYKKVKDLDNDFKTHRQQNQNSLRQIIKKLSNIEMTISEN